MNIGFDDFKKIEMKVGEVVEAERVEGSDKLVKLVVDIGSEKRQIVAGIAKHYSPEELKGRQVSVVANLEPRDIFGHQSQGMLLAADIDGRPVLISPDENVDPGSRIR